MCVCVVCVCVCVSVRVCGHKRYRGNISDEIVGKVEGLSLPYSKNVGGGNEMANAEVGKTYAV